MKDKWYDEGMRTWIAPRGRSKSIFSGTEYDYLRKALESYMDRSVHDMGRWESVSDVADYVWKYDIKDRSVKYKTYSKPVEITDLGDEKIECDLSLLYGDQNE